MALEGVLNCAFSAFKSFCFAQLTLDPLFDLGNFIGKVFWDKNENGYQDEGENPIPFVTIVTEDGTVVITDKNGRYHIPAIKTRKTCPQI